MGYVSVGCRAAFLAAFVALAGPAAGQSGPPQAPPTQGCDALVTGAEAPTVAGAVNMDTGDKRIRLGDVVTVTGKNLDKLFDRACAGRSVVLFLNGWPLADVRPNPPVNPAAGSLNFKLVNRHFGEGADNPWLPILGSPRFRPLKVKVSVGFANGFAMQPAQNALPELELKVLSEIRLLIWGAIFIGMLVTFWYLVRHTTVLRDPGPAGTEGLYSLSRSQGALWFFVILAAYLFIGIVTGDFNDTINSTALILLGIGAGTVLGSAAIDAQKKADATAPTPPEKSEGYFHDILSDANGISFHRFQLAAWTLVLSIVFITDVYRTLAMPSFNTTLMGLLGLSAGTYLGLKIPEATTKTKAS